VFRGYQAEVRHQLWRRLETGEIAQLHRERPDDDGGDELYAAQRLQRFHQRRQVPALYEFGDGVDELAAVAASAAAPRVFQAILVGALK
jgi:hypothetical protein